MIDWVNAVLPFRHSAPIFGGTVVSHDEAGTLQWASNKKKTVEGSFTSALRIATSSDHPLQDDAFTHIWISGSPKFVQGHNLFGTSDPRLLAAHLAREGLKALGLETDPFTFNTWKSGRGVTFTVLDVTEMLDTGTELDAAQWIEAAQEQTRVKYRGRGVCQKGTLYFGQHSRRWALKLYQKFAELQSKKKGHALPEHIPQRELLLDYARGTVRAELRFHSLELKRLGLADGENWNAGTARALWEKYMQSLELSGQRPLAGSDLETIKPHLRGTYALWREGRDVASLLPRRTYYRQRSELKRYGIDIAMPCLRQHANVVPLLRTITAQPKPIPSWAVNTPLLIAA